MADDQCAFGKWLKRTDLPGEIRSSSDYAHICSLHSRFHQCAGTITELACAGKLSEAREEMGNRGCFNQISSELVSALNKWKLSARQTG